MLNKKREKDSEKKSNLIGIDLPFVDKEINTKKKGLTPTKIVVAITGVVVVVILGVALSLMQADQVKPSSNVQKEVADSDNVNVQDTQSGLTIDEVQPFLAEDGVSSETLPVKPIQVSKGNALYENGLMRIRFEYPETWFVTETTSNALGDIPKGEFNIEKSKLTNIIPLADFFTSGNPANSDVEAILVPKSMFSKYPGVVDYFVTEDQNVTSVKKSTKKYGSYKANVLVYTLDYLGDKYTGTQVSVAFGPNILVINGKTKATEKLVMHDEVISNMVKTLQLVKGGKLNESIKEKDNSEDMVTDNK